MAERAVYVRIGVKDSDRALAALRSFGIEGEKAIGRIGAAGEPASRGLAAVNAVAGQLRGELAGTASRAGLVGTGLSAMGAAGLVAAAGLGSAAVAAKEIVKAGDEYRQFAGRLAAATGSAQAAAGAFQTLYTQTRATGGSLEDSVASFVRFNIAAKGLGKSQQDVARLVDIVQKFGAVSGASSQEASAGALQLGQALASGVLQGDELRSILENMPSLAEALAASLGVPIGKLREMGAAGELTADKVFEALLKAGKKADDAFSQLPVTVDRASSMAGTAWQRFAAEIDKSLGLSEKLAGVLMGVADALDGMASRVAKMPAAAAARLESQFDTMVAQLRELEDIEQQFPGTYTDGRGNATGELASTRAVVASMRERLEATRAVALQEDVLAAAMQEKGDADRARTAEEKRKIDAKKAELDLVKDLLPLEKARIDREEKLTKITEALNAGQLDQARATELSVAAQEEYEDAVERVTHAKRDADKAAEDATRAAEKEAEARDAATEKIKDQIAGLIDERNQLAMTERERFIHNEVLKAEKIARDELGAGADAYVEKVRKEAGALYDKRKAADDAAAADKKAKQARDDFLADQKRVAEGVGDRVTKYAGEVIFDAMEGRSESFWKTFATLGKRAFAEIAAKAVVQTFIQPIINGAVSAVPSLFGVTMPSASGAGAAVGQGGLSLNNAASLVSTGQSLYNGFTGATAAQFANAGTWIAETSVGHSMGLSTAYPLMTGGGATPVTQVGTIYAQNASGASLSSTLGSIGAGVPYGLAGGLGGSIIGTATNSKAIGGLSGAALGAGSAGAVEAIFGAGAAGGPWGIAAAAVIAAVVAMLGTQKKTVGPNSSGNVVLNGSGGFRTDNALADNGADAGQMQSITDSVASAMNAIITGIGAKLTGGDGANTGLFQYFQKDNKWYVTPTVGENSGKRKEFTDQNEATIYYMRESLKGLIADGKLTGVSGDVQTALKNSKATKAEDFVADLQYASTQRETIDALTKSIGLEDAARKAGKQSADELATAITKFRDKAADLALNVNEANAATKKWVDDLVAGVEARTYTEGEAAAATTTAKWENMGAVLRAVGYTADEAAAKIKTGLANELGHLADAKLDNLQQRKYEAAGRGYLNQIKGLQDALEVDARDLAALGKPITEAHATFDEALRSVLNGLTEAELADVTRTLGGDIGTLAESMRSASAEAAALTRSQDRRARAMTAAGNTAGATLYQFDLDAAAQTKAAKEAGASAAELAELGNVLGLERARIVMEQARADVLEAIDRQVAAINDNSQSARDLVAANAEFAKSVRTKIADRLIGDNSPLDAEQRLAEVTRQIGELMPKALGGDADARSRVLDLIDRRDELAKAVYASSSSSDFTNGTDLLEQLGASADDQLDQAEKAVKIADDTLKELQRQRDQAERLGQRNLASLDILNGTLTASFAQLEDALSRTSGLNGYNPQLSSIIANATAEQLPSLLPMAQQSGPVLWTEFLRRADQLGAGDAYTYHSPADVQSKSEGMTTAQLEDIAHSIGWTGGYTREFNYWLVTTGKQQAFIDAIRNAPIRAYGFGGNIPVGGYGIVGETGRPELVAGPATVFDPHQTARLVALANGRAAPANSVDMGATNVLLGRLAGLLENQLGLTAAAGDGTFARLDRIASTLSEQSARDGLRQWRAA